MSEPTNRPRWVQVGLVGPRMMGMASLLAMASLGHCADERIAFFETHIRPVLVERCYECHSSAANKSQGELLLDSRTAMLEGGTSGPALIPNDPNNSLIMEALRYQSLEMPPSGKLDDSLIAKFDQWIRMGAPDPRELSGPASGLPKVDWTAADNHWAFRPVADRVPVPFVNADWANNALDAFVHTKLRQADIDPSPPISKSTWLRRVSFDLVGLPPTPEQLQAFIEDDRPDAFERVVDRLLASSRYGERHGRHWLDLARYADSNGADENHAYPVAWRYRDYVVQAMNADVPYDRFILEQMAGDLLPADSEAERGRLLTATGFLVIGPKMLAEQDKPKLVADLVDEQLDTFGKVFMGLTLGCARCHDHKFDPIKSEDYYALAGVFHSTKSMRHLEFVSKWNERELPNQQLTQQIAEKTRLISQVEAELTPLDTELRRKLFETQLGQLQQLLRWRTQSHTPTTAELESLKLSEKQSARFEKFLSLADWKSKQSFEPLEDELIKLVPDRDTITTSEQLIEGFSQALRQAWQAVQNVERDEQGDIKKPRLAKLYGSLYGGRGPFEDPKNLEAVVSDEDKQRLVPLQQRLAELKKALPTLDQAMAADDGPVKLVAINVRGNHLQTAGEPLPRQVPQILQSATTSVHFPNEQSGRLELAQWLTDPRHPLTARVMTNRIWQYHFGEGLVRSASNFGLRGEQPTHPELLEYATNRFMAQGWSQKALHRQIVLSASYRMASDQTETGKTKDPDNRLLWRMNRRRLEVEPLRDSLLVVADGCDWRIGGQAEAIYGAKFEDTQETRTLHDAARRTIYLPVNRAALEEFFATFDYVDSAVSLEKRPVTTVPHQALYMMNHRLAMHAGYRVAQRLEQHSSDDLQRLAFAYAICFARAPTSVEITAAQDFLARQRGSLASTTGAPPENHTDKSLEPWIRLCRSLLLTSEFIYVD